GRRLQCGRGGDRVGRQLVGERSARVPPMISITGESVVVGYASYLAIIAIASRRFQRASRWTLAAAFASWTLWASAIHMTRTPLGEALVPLPILLAGY